MDTRGAQHLTSPSSPAACNTSLSIARARLDEGVAASQAGEARRATELFEEASALVPAWHLPPFLLGSEYAALSDFERAEGYFAQAVLLAPDFHIARYQLGLLQFSGGRTSIAMLTWAPLVSLADQDAPFPHLVRGFEALAQGQLDSALAHFETGLPLAQDNQALAADVRRVLAALGQQLQTSTGAETAAATDEDVAAMTASHVLLSNYDKGTVH
jgi:tetratricopeptide (TPR) repeat protein